MQFHKLKGMPRGASIIFGAVMGAVLLFNMLTYSLYAKDKKNMPEKEASPTLQYPDSHRGDIVETMFGKSIADPYRWLENDIRGDAQVATWVDEQNKVTADYLDDLSGLRDKFAERMGDYFEYDAIGIPTVRGERHFFAQRKKGQDQAALILQMGDDGTQVTLIDPNKWSDDNADALGDWKVSPDGSKLLYAIQKGGTDWRSLRVMNVDEGRLLPDEVEWAKFTNLAWDKNGDGFFYSRFRAPVKGEEFQALNENQQIYYHRLGTQQSADILIHETPHQPELNHIAEMGDEHRWLLVRSSSGTDARYGLTLYDLKEHNDAIDGHGKPPAKILVDDFKHDWVYIGTADEQLYFITNRDAPRGRIVRVNPHDMAVQWMEVVAQSDAVIFDAAFIGGRIILSTIKDAKSELRSYAYNGTDPREIALPDIGQVTHISSAKGKETGYYRFTSFHYPASIFKIEDGQANIWKRPELSFNPDDFMVSQRFYKSKDGTKVPLFLFHHKKILLGDGAPTLLYGYGGFNISILPGFSPARLSWVEMGGVFAVANIRGGGEYGAEWHDGGRLLNKQNVFDDFISAGEYLIDQGISTPDGLTIEGRSNGGLLVGAVLNQRPDLFAAGHAAVGVMDMLRFDKFTAGRYWVDDYGYPSKEEDFYNLLGYSPYHNVKKGTSYPAIIVSTADTDDRVVPGHSFKYTAALQHADIGDKPHIIRVETRAGHGSGKPVSKFIEEYADIYAFLGTHSGM